jgi:hypothetical protein
MVSLTISIFPRPHRHHMLSFRALRSNGDALASRSLSLSLATGQHVSNNHHHVLAPPPARLCSGHHHHHATATVQQDQYNKWTPDEVIISSPPNMAASNQMHGYLNAAGFNAHVPRGNHWPPRLHLTHPSLSRYGLTALNRSSTCHILAHIPTSTKSTLSCSGCHPSRWHIIRFSVWILDPTCWAWLLFAHTRGALSLASVRCIQ